MMKKNAVSTNNIFLFLEIKEKYQYHNKSTYWDKQAGANSVDPDQLVQYAGSNLGLHPLSLICQSHIMKTRLFKYIENFTSKNWKVSDKKTDIFIFLFKT